MAVIESISDAMLENFKNECVKTVGVQQIRIHDFRHSHSSLLINNRVNISIISKMLRYSSIKETIDAHSHLYSKIEEETVELINSLG